MPGFAEQEGWSMAQRQGVHQGERVHRGYGCRQRAGLALSLLLAVGTEIPLVRAAERYGVEPPTHQWIALQAYRKLLADRGAADPLVAELSGHLPTAEGNPHYSGAFNYSANWSANQDAPYDSATALIEGACEEDRPETRSVHHFWDFNPELTSIFYSLADYADQFDSET